MAKKRKLSRADRWQIACGDARDGVERFVSAAQDLSADDMHTAAEEINNALTDLADIQTEYQDWYDNMPEGLRDSSPTGEKLSAITEIDLSESFDIDAILEAIQEVVTEAVEPITDALDESENAELPSGFGRD